MVAERAQEHLRIAMRLSWLVILNVRTAAGVSYACRIIELLRIPDKYLEPYIDYKTGGFYEHFSH